MSILDGLTPTEYLVLDVMVARWRLGDDSWTFPTTFRPALDRLEQRGYLNYKSGVVYQTLHAWLTDEGARFAKLDQPYVLHGEQRGRVWTEDPGSGGEAYVCEDCRSPAILGWSGLNCTVASCGWFSCL